jgi:spore germination protein KA
VDYIGSATMLQSYIEEQPSALMPQMLTTERPDRTAAYLSEGSLAIIADCSPTAIIMPTTFWSLMQTAEDYYLRFPFGTFVRLLRFVALLLALALPGLFIAATTFHQEMIPTELMLSIAANREAVPMPAVLELLLMDLSFELIREAGTRVPDIIGSTIGIIGGLILGQAAVAAKLVSPLMVIVVAITGLASFAIPNYPTAFSVRLLRFGLILLGATLGFYGIAAALFASMLHLCSLRSLGVPLLGRAVRPSTASSDTFLRPMLYAMENRPEHARTLDARRQAHVTRPWDPSNPLRTRPDHHSDRRRR